MENCTDLHTDAQYREFFRRTQFVTALIAYPLICSFGITANIVSIVVIASCKFASPTNVFLVSLAVSDTIKLTNDFLYFVSILLQRLSHDGEQSSLLFLRLYPYSHFFMQASNCITAWIIVAITIERFVLVTLPSRAKRVCNLARSKMHVALIYASLTLLCLPYLLRYEVVQCPTGRWSNASGNAQRIQETRWWRMSPHKSSYTWFVYTARVLTPLIILCVLNLLIVRVLRRTQSRRRLMHRHRITVMLLTVVLVFMISILPDAVLSTVLNYGFAEEGFLIRGIREITDVFVCFNAACNFILYFIFNTVFKSRFISIFCWRCSDKPQLQFHTSGSGSGPKLYVSLRLPTARSQEGIVKKKDAEVQSGESANVDTWQDQAQRVHIVRMKTQRRRHERSNECKNANK